MQQINQQNILDPTFANDFHQLQLCLKISLRLGSNNIQIF